MSIIKRALKTIGATGATITAGIAAYHMFYHQQYKMDHHFEGEKSIMPETPLPQSTLLDKIMWVTDEFYEQEIQDIVLPYIQRFEKSGIVEINTQPIEYLFFKLAKPKATVVIVHGFNEYKEKYLELIYYYLQMGIQVFVYDARGHGNSKISPSQENIDMTEFNVYAEDLKYLIDYVVKSESASTPIVLYGHSMGGAVATLFAEQYPHVAKLLMLTAPMMAMDLGKLPHSIANLMGKTSTLLGRGKQLLKNSTPLTPLPEDDQLAFLMTDSKRKVYYQRLNRKIHDKPTWGASNNWFKTAHETMNQVRQVENIKRINMPVLIIKAENDTQVLAEGIYTLANALPNVRLYNMRQAQHNLLMSDDHRVYQCVTMMAHFIEHNQAWLQGEQHND